jgi:glycosyltransferase involved in cell wall biosynthesis
MRVAFYGNICNNFYTLAKALRNELNIDAHLYLNDKADFQNRPESDDPSIKNNYPDWIHLSPQWDVLPFLKNWDKTFIKELNQYDVVFLSELGVVFTPFLNGKTLFYVTGGDLTQTPFPRKYSDKFKSIKDRLVWEYIGFMQRRGIRKATKILSQPFFPFVNALKELKVNGSQVSNCYFPILMDLDVVKRRDKPLEEIDDFNRQLLAPFGFVIFHPSRIVLQQTEAFIQSGQWKGNDNLFRALALFVRKYNVEDICLAMPDRIYSRDREKARCIIKELGIERNIVWLKPPTPEGFPRKQLMNFYSIADIVADEFATGWFGSIVVEGMACGKPTFCYVDEKVMRQLYAWHPIVSVKQPEAIAEKIAEFYFDPQKKEELGELSRQWATEFHSVKVGTRVYINNFKRDLLEIFKKNT